MDDTEKNPHWALHFIVKHGNWLAIITGAVPLVACIAAVICGAPLWLIAAGAVGTAFLFLLMRSYVELVRVMVDMLLPK